MNFTFSCILGATAVLASGCAAPMTEIVATRQGETIEKHHFKEGDYVWVTYQEGMRKRINLDSTIIQWNPWRAT